MLSLRATIVGLCLSFCAVACGDGELLVHVERADDGVEGVDRLHIEVFQSSRVTPYFQERTESFSGLPQSFLVTGGTDRTVRIRVTGEHEGAPVAAGDGVVEVPSSGRDDVTIKVHSECRDVVCPRLQSCVIRDLVALCDGRCANGDECSNLLGCAPGAECAASGSGQTCEAPGADADSDGFRDARCATDPERGIPERIDCDDTFAAAQPAGDRSCGQMRDHDCDGIPDDYQLCISQCASLDEIELGTAENISAADNILQVAALRGEPAQRLLFVVTDGAVKSLSVPGGGAVSVVSEVSATGVHAIAVVGPLLAAATDAGLVLVSIASDGSLAQIGDPIGIPPEAPTALSTIEMSDNTVWVSGEGLGIAAIDVRNPDIPRFLGHVEGPAATQLERLESDVLASTADPARSVVLYPAPARGEPSEGAVLTDMLGIAGMEVTGLGAQRKASGLPEVIAIGLPGGFRTYERIGSDVFELRDMRETNGAVEALYFDRGTLVFGTASDVAGAFVRTGVSGRLTNAKDEESLGAPTATPTFAISTNAAGAARIVSASGQAIRIATFGCGS